MVNDDTNAQGDRAASKPESSQPATPAPAPTPTTPSSPGEVPHTALQNDISSILKEVKLPDRAAPAPKTQKTYDTMLPDDPRRMMSETAPTVKPPSAAPSEKNPPATPVAEKQDIRSLHTLKDDLQDVVRDTKMSVVKAAALEEEKRAHGGRLADVTPTARPHHTFAIFFSIILIALGALALGAVYVLMQENAGGTTIENDALLFAEQNIPLPIDGLSPTDMKRTLASARQSGILTLGAILHIVPTKTVSDPATNSTSQLPISFAEFLTAIGADAPDELVRALDSEYFLGIHTVDESAPLLVIPVTSYERAFAAMLAWEGSMNSDLAPLFTEVSKQTLGPDGLPVERVFTDTVMRNYDVRTLADESGAVQLYYSFPTRNILIIAESPFSFAEILSRLRADRRL